MSTKNVTPPFGQSPTSGETLGGCQGLAGGSAVYGATRADAGAVSDESSGPPWRPNRPSIALWSAAPSSFGSHCHATGDEPVGQALEVRRNATPHESLVVLGPVSDVVLRLVLRVYS